MVNSESIWVAHRENVGIHFRDDALLLQLGWHGTTTPSHPPRSIGIVMRLPLCTQITNEMSLRSWRRIAQLCTIPIIETAGSLPRKTLEIAV